MLSGTVIVICVSEGDINYDSDIELVLKEGEINRITRRNYINM